MKKLLALMFVFALVFAGCSSNDQPESQQPSQEVQSSEPAPVEPTTPSSNSSDAFKKFESGLDSLGIDYEISESFFEMIGAKDGKKYNLESGTVELYQFDTSSDAYKEMVDSGEMKLYDFDVSYPVEVNGAFALYLDEVDNPADIIDLFGSL